MKDIELKREIRKLLKEKKAILLSHNYQRDEIQEIADITGDSLGLSMEASRTDAEVIVFCGVHFMAESASILCPDKIIILPRMEAGCPMADMITPEELEAKKALYPDAVVVTYVNSSAAVKAVSDICCTSANAIKVVNSVPQKRVLMTPDRNLANYVSKYSAKEIIPWDGFCPTHERLRLEEVERTKKAYPEALFVVHPECRPEVLELADHICSTSGMYSYARNTDAPTFMMGTEMGILYRLRKENPRKKFILPSKNLICPNMKLISLKDVYRCLKNMKNIVKVPEQIRIPAKKALDKMLAIPRD